MHRLTCSMIALSLAASVAATAQPQWQRLTGSRPLLRSSAAYAYDPVQGRVFAFGTDDGRSAETWAWDGGTWTRLRPGTSPSARFGFQMVYDSGRGRVVLFGGQVDGRGPSNETWEWDGRDWIRRTPTLSPPGRCYHAMAYDAARARTVLYGGRGTYSTYGDLWEWDGTNWTQRTPATLPNARSEHAMAYDPARRRTVLFGGRSATAWPNDAWEWDGVSWTRLAPTNAPPGRTRPVMAWDAVRQRVVMAGSGGPLGSSPAQEDLWRWDGANWTRDPAATLPRGAATGLVFDAARSRLVLFLARPNRATSDDVWVSRGGKWQRASPTNTAGRTDTAIAYDTRRRTSWMFGGNDAWGPPNVLADTWGWDGTTWRSIATGTSPPPRHGHAIVYDPVRDRTLLFGGRAGVTDRGDTWAFDGTTWTRIRPTSSPAARAGHGLTYDTRRRRIVLFGGSTGTRTRFGDTWEWDGSTWTLRAAAGGPTPRDGAALAYDPVSGRTILFGGEVTSGCAPVSCASDTWAWDGATWTNVTPTTPGPTARRDAAIAYDAARQRIVMTGGWCEAGNNNCNTITRYDTWEWNGVAWVPGRALPTNPGYSGTTTDAIYDGTRGRVVALDASSMTLSEYAARDLTASPHTVSLATGGAVQLSLAVGPRLGRRGYVVAGCFDSGMPRGIRLGRRTLLLNPDAYFWLTVTQPGLVIRNGIGRLDKSGRATATVRIPPGLPANLAGQRLFHAAVIYGNAIAATTTPVPLTLVP